MNGALNGTAPVGQGPRPQNTPLTSDQPQADFTPDECIRYSRGSCKFDNTPEQRISASFADFHDAVLADRSPRKGVGMICGPLAPAPDTPHHREKRVVGQPYRSADTALPRRWIGLDLDGCPDMDALGEVCAHLSRYAGFGYTTASHKPESPRARFVIEPDRALPRAELMAASAAMREEVSAKVPGLVWDAACDRPEQPLFLPPVGAAVFRFDGEPYAPALAPAATAAPKGTSGTAIPQGHVVTEGRHADVVLLAARVARMVHKLGLSNEAGMAMLKEEQARGRWSRDVTDELHRAYRDALAKLRAGVWKLDRPQSVSVDGDEWPPAIIDQSAHPHSDHANAHRIVRAFGAGMLFVPGLGWHTFAPPWKPDELAVRRAAAGLGRIVATEAAEMMQRAADIEDEDARKEAIAAAEARGKWARTSEMRSVITSGLSMAEPLLAVPVDRIDQNAMLLGCRNGVLDLRTGQLRPHRRSDLITQCAAVEFDARATAPTWQRFVGEVFAGDTELIEFMQRFLGYCLTGSTAEHMLVVAHGSGSNGKSTLFETIRQLLGSYGKTAAPGLLIARRGERHPTEILDLRGARLVCSSETGEGGRLAEDLVKSLTGGDGLKGRAMRQDFVDFLPTFKLVLFTNHRPIVTGQDHGIWRRLRLVPFNQTFDGPRKDVNLPAKLRAEWPGILNWCLAGLARYLRDGFNQCRAIENASAQYKADSDVLGQFIEDECITGPGFEEAAGELYRVFRLWAAEAGIHPMAKRTFGMRLEERGYVSRRGAGGVRKWLGMKLCSDRSQSWAA